MSIEGSFSMELPTPGMKAEGGAEARRLKVCGSCKFKGWEEPFDVCQIDGRVIMNSKDGCEDFEDADTDR